ncbi:MAG: FKBP-type peptidyl-prolyl cis-trans isomerase [Desulfobacterales bacterium]|jgi:FKBP-type peptidyl-prolyl cis-trans isomerase FklB|nr:FKBP-type peptidyl-prolyl cis-trans isomerase [Desulfobacterales bacterium]MDD3082911.1 FKBP-type peptidyl-prolyl cis-trans isomerase [Desulfobacterales bacterium]MDD3951877.1 FKBP-type peptidyl-prolyl cis-trans isomerase [Desulfobacterales bacterium]MDD4463832.1 FKBP-type peptidyl-prolyl cis-trans isomerase [Desulfobacterales bacterium]MDY0378007.1 FKBP-type peptidyl-prolyl cis-trans isomerase [Desulfobacterales bacterium]
MKQILCAVLAVFLVTVGCTAEEKKAEVKKAELSSPKDKVSYGIGMNIGRNFSQQEFDVNPDILAQGIKDVLAGGQTLMTEEEARTTLMNFQQEMAAKQQAKLKELAEKNRLAGEAFMAENARKEGVVTLPSGLQYKVLVEGTGKTPGQDDTVTVNYRGTLIDGKEFDSSYKRGEPATFPIEGVIPGWTEALQLMKEGAKWQLFIPSALAYGESGAGPDITPNSSLIFEVELISIQPKETVEKP